MFIAIFDPLRQAGVDVRPLTSDPPSPFDAIVDLVVDGRRSRFLVETKARAPYPSEIPRFVSGRTFPKGFPLLVAPFISPAVGAALAGHGWSWVDETGNYEIRAPGIRLARRVEATRRDGARRRRSTAPSLPQGPGSWGVIRFLVSHGEVPLRASHLANMAGVTQPRASQVLSSLVRLDLVERTPQGWLANRDALLDAFLESYPGPGGREAYYYTLEPLLAAAAELTRTNAVGTYVSADVGPDLVAPWRQPTHLIVYGKRQLHIPDGLAVKAKGWQDANVVVIVPDDRSTVCRIQHEISTYGTVLRLAEHTQVVWDLLRLGGDDRREAATEFRKWLLRNPYQQ